MSLNIKRRKKRKPPKPRNDQEKSSELETEYESSDSQCFVDASNFVADFPEDIDSTTKLLADNALIEMLDWTFGIRKQKIEGRRLAKCLRVHLRTKWFWVRVQLQSVKENIKLKSHIYL